MQEEFRERRVVTRERENARAVGGRRIESERLREKFIEEFVPTARDKAIKMEEIDRLGAKKRHRRRNE